MARTGTPAFTGLALHRDRKWRFSFWYPHEWHRYDWTDGREGVLYAPHPTDYSSSFSVEVKDLGTEITAADKEDLHIGFLEGLSSLPECEIETEESWAAGNLIGCEAKYTFRESGRLRKRWSRLLFEGSRQFHFVAQGASPDEYEYWEPMLFEAMETVHID
jgi:hypothetical protein